MLKIEMDDEAFTRQYSYKTHPITIKIKRKDMKIAYCVISQFGEECTTVLET